jgi:hypothetical protein
MACYVIEFIELTNPGEDLLSPHGQPLSDKIRIRLPHRAQGRARILPAGAGRTRGGLRRTDAMTLDGV